MSRKRPNHSNNNNVISPLINNNRNVNFCCLESRSHNERCLADCKSRMAEYRSVIFSAHLIEECSFGFVISVMT